MPPNVVKTPRDEELWIEAKSAAARAGHPGDYAYIMGIFKKMKGGSLGKCRFKKSIVAAAAVAGATAAARRSSGGSGGAAPPRTKMTLGQRIKAAMGKRPKGAGWTPVPGGKHGGYRKWSGSRWMYWYPGMDQPASEGRAEAHLAETKKKKAKEDAEKKVKKLESKGAKAQKRYSRALDAGDSRERAHHHRDQARQHFEEADKLRREHGMPARMTRKSLVISKAAVSASKPPPGFTPIQGSSKGGYHMKQGTRYIYWYPGVGITRQAHADDHGKAPGAKPAAGKKPMVAKDKPKAKHELDHGADGRPETIRDPSQLPPGFNDLPKAQRAAMTAHYDHVTEGMNERFGEAAAYKGDIRKAMDSHVDELVSQGHIIPGNAERAKKMFRGQYDAGIKAGLNKQLLAEAMHENVRKVAHQEVEASRRTLGDHGVRHLAVNCEQASKVFDALEAGGSSVTPLQRFMAYQVMVDHDMGYTIPAIAQGGFAVKDNYHPEASTVMSFQQRDKLEKLFGGSEHFEQYVRGVANHSGSEVDWEKDPFGSAIRLADNTHLFADKMPEVLFDSTAAVEAMVKIKMATDLIPPTVKEEVVDKDGKKETKMKRTPEDKARFKKLVAGVKSQLVAEIRKRDDIPDSTRQNLIKAAGEIGELTPKFLISRLAGRSPNFEFKNGTMNCVIEQSNARHTIGQVFGDDEEDKQFAKLLKDYGTDAKKVLGTKPPPPRAKIGEKGTLEFQWKPPKDIDPAERRHAETMSKYKTEFDTIKALADGKEKDAAMAKFFGTEGSMKKSARIGSVNHGLAEDEAIAEMLEKGGLGVDGAIRHTSLGATGLRKSVNALGGTIHQGELIKPGNGVQSNPQNHADDREAYQRAQTAAQVQDFDGAGNHGCGGLREWFEGSYDLNDPDIASRVNVPMTYTGISKSAEPPTQVIDTDDPRLRAIHRTPTPDGGARSAIDFVYKRDADR